MNDFYRFNERALRPGPDDEWRERLRQHLDAVNQAYDLRYEPQPEGPADLEWEERMPPDPEYKARSARLLEVGIKVHTRVRFDTYSRANPLLMIEVDKLPDWNDSDWVSNAPINPAVHRHISIVYWEKLHDVPQWWVKVDHLYRKFDNKDLWLYGSRVTAGATLVLDPRRDPIASDEVVQELHNTMEVWNRDDDGNWAPNVPELHISM